MWTRTSWVTPAFGVATGMVLAVISAMRGRDWISILFPLIFAVGLVVVLNVWGRDRELPTLVRGEGDERQRSISRSAMEMSYYAMIAVALVGAVWELAFQPRMGKFGIVALVGVSVQLLATVVLGRRR
ncbi:MAG TPA: hypothetical protein VNE62_00440 [Actinomycetota bacterium]|nr:hypothetical protein [Actinomycetota bacterium]